MKDRIARCSRCQRESLLVREGSTWCFSGCSFFGAVVPLVECLKEEPAPMEAHSEEHSAPATVRKPLRRDVDDFDHDWSPAQESIL